MGSRLLREKFAPPCTPIIEAQLIPDWETPVRWWDLTTSSYLRTTRLVAYMTYLENWRQQPTISTTIRTCMTNWWFTRGNKENFTQIHGDICQPLHMDKKRTLPTSRTRTTWWHEDGSDKFPTLLPTVQIEAFQTWRNENAIDGLDNKLIRILQEDELVGCMNGAIVQVITVTWREAKLHSRTPSW